MGFAVRAIKDGAELTNLVQNTKDKLIVVDWYASWSVDYNYIRFDLALP